MNLPVSVRHENELIGFLRFCRNQRIQAIKDISKTMEEISGRSLGSESNFTRKEVLNLLSSIQKNISTEVESEMIHLTHMNALLLRQYFEQADKWFLTLKSNLAELEKKDLLNSMAIFENERIVKNPLGMTKLTPLESPSTDLLQHEVERLRRENETLTKALNEKGVLQLEQHTAVDPSLKAKISSLESETESLKEKLSNLQRQLDQKLSSSTTVKNLYTMLDAKQHYIDSLVNRLGKDSIIIDANK